jgi:hypothetical protein
MYQQCPRYFDIDAIGHYNGVYGKQEMPVWKKIQDLEMQSKDILFNALSRVQTLFKRETERKQSWWFQEEKETSQIVRKGIQHTSQVDSKKLWKAKPLRKVWEIGIIGSIHTMVKQWKL